MSRPRLGPVRALAVGSLAVLAALLLAELTVRLLARPQRISKPLVVDAELGFRHPPTRTQSWDARGSYEFTRNSLGFRGAELPAEGEPPTQPRVLLLGDSFVHARGVREEDWVGGSLAAELERAGTPADVFALCCNDWGTAQQLLALRRYGARVDPDVVVLVVYPPNDLANNTLELAGRASVSPGDYFRPYLVPDGAGGFTRRYARPWLARLRGSRLFGRLEERWLAGRMGEGLRAELVGDAVDERDEVFREPAPGERWDTAWRTTLALMDAVRDEVGVLGARFVIAVIPGRLQVERPVSERFGARRGKGSEPSSNELDLELPERRLEEWFHREGVAHVQLLSPLRQLARERRSSVYNETAHLDGEAHRLFGQLLAQRLAPGAADLCHVPAGEVVDVPVLQGAPPLEFDFTRAEHLCLFGEGWSDWQPLRSNPAHAGWALDVRGDFLAHAGRVTLRGRLTSASLQAARIAVARGESPDVALAEQAIERPGEFTLRFDLPRTGADPWQPLCLRLVAPPGNPAAPRVLLQSLRIEP